MAIRSKLLRDQPEKPIERAVWWIEYVIRHPHSSHLRTPTTELGFFRSNSLDLYAILYSTFLLVLFSVLWLAGKLRKLCNGSGNKIKIN